MGFAFSDLGFEVQRFKIWGWGFDLGFAHHWLVLDSAISNPSRAGAGSGFRENLFSDHRTIWLIKLMASTVAVICYKEAVQFSASFVMSLFASS